MEGGVREGEESSSAATSWAGSWGVGGFPPSTLVSRETCLLGEWKQHLWLQFSSEPKFGGTHRTWCFACLEKLFPSPWFCMICPLPPALGHSSYSCTLCPWGAPPVQGRDEQQPAQLHTVGTCCLQLRESLLQPAACENDLQSSTASCR